MTLNQIILGDALGELHRLPAESFAAVITSPPYNLGDKNPPSKSQRKGIRQPGHCPVEYAEGFDDNLPPDDYVNYHRLVVFGCLAALRPDGLLWYFHRRRPDYNPHTARRLVDRVLDGMPVRSEIIWAKGPGLNHCTAGPGKGYYYPAPAYETIFLLAKDKSALLARDEAKYGDVWTIRQDKNPHPAPFSLDVARRCLLSTQADGPVLDPFMGSGTTAMAALYTRRDYLGIERSQAYITAANDRITKARSCLIGTVPFCWGGIK